MTCNVGPDLCYTRGDTAPIVLRLTADGAALDLTGWTSFILTIDPSEEPTGATNNLDAMPGTIQTPPGADGVIGFQPSGADENARRATSEAYVPGEYFYDLQGINPAGNRTTLLKAGGKFTVYQDITKV
jgi:hypothetical protein